MPLPMLEIDYERTVSDLPSTTRQLLEWIGLPFNERCLRFHETNRPIRTASVSQVRRPVYSKSVDRWKNYAPYLDDLLSGFEIPD